MEKFENYLNNISNSEHRNKVIELFDSIVKKFPNLIPQMAWNQPMFTDHGTFIIGFSISKKHLAVAPEQITIEKFSDEIKNAGYEHTKNIFRIPWDKKIDLSLIEKIIEFNVLDKTECTTFWRP
jgi:hypothetical protein